jgi:DNA repair protein RadC
MRDVAPHDRPREKLERHGPAALGDNELLALVLGSGTRGRGALDLANRVINRFGGVHRLARVGVADLRQILGVGRARAAQVLAAVELGRRTLLREAEAQRRMTTPDALAAYLLPEYGSRPVEHFGVVMLDTKHHLLRVQIVAVGTLDSAAVHPRDVFRDATVMRAAAVVLFHNHPSGDPRPSRDDVTLTVRMLSAGEIIGIEVLDHLILADQRYFSMREAGVIAQAADDQV